jgi:hypothetical protein
MPDAIFASAITGATAVLSGLLGYGGAKGQRKLETRRLELDQRKSQRQLAFEEEERLAQHQDALRDSRRDLYIEHLAVIDEWWRVARRGLTGKKFNVWWDRYNEVDNRIELLGAERVARASYPMYAAIDALRADIDWEASDLVAEGGRVADIHGGPIGDARQDLLKEMRADLQSPT